MAGKHAMDADKFLKVQWMPCLIEGKRYIIKYILHPTSYHVLLSDLVYIYHEDMDSRLILLRSKEYNPKIEIDTPGILKELRSILDKWVANLDLEGKEITVINHSSSSFVLKFESCLAGISFVWQFNLTSLDSSILFTHVVQPLFVIACELRRQNHELMKIIKKKDTEIKDYKDNGGKVSFKYLETPPFKEEEFVQSMSKTENIIESLKMPLETVFCDSLYSYVSSGIESMSVKHDDCMQNELVAAKKNKISEVIAEVSSQSEETIERVEERRQDLLVHQCLDHKVKKKPKKKPLKI